MLTLGHEEDVTGLERWSNSQEYRATEFDSRHQHGGFQLSISPVSGAPMPSPDFCGYCMHTSRDVYTSRLKKHSYT